MDKKETIQLKGIARLEPAVVTKGTNGEYFIEEENKGKLYFRSLN